MTLTMFAVFDRTAGFYFPPFFARTATEAIRAFDRMMADPQRTGAPSEYDLFSLAEFDDQSGSVTPAPQSLRLANGAEFKREVSNEVPNRV